MTDTIVALSSGAPPSAIGVLRMSGPDALSAARAIAGDLPPPREARVRSLRHEGVMLDRAIMLVFPGPNTATGEDLVEFHLHGGRAVVASVEAALLAQPCVRAAEAGEFTRRALINGRIDLTQAEALADLLAAETEAQRRTAILASEGMLRRNIAHVERSILDAAAKVELLLDFSDEDDAAPDDAALAHIRIQLSTLAAELGQWMDAPTVDRLKDGFRIVLAGPPNAGKSTLLNCLAGRNAAIVSDIAGTTRDLIEVPIARNGIPYLLIDTAGLAEHTSDPVEQIGIGLTRSTLETADVIIWLGDDDAPVESIGIHSRCDLVDRLETPVDRIAVSAATGEGIAALWSAIEARIAYLMPPLDGRAVNKRQRNLLRQISGHVSRGIATSDPLLVAHELAQARTAIDALTGRAGVESMLDALFGQFCIGK